MEQTPAPVTKRSLPVLSDLYENKELAAKNNALNILLNAPPRPEWIETHPFAKKKVEVNGVKKDVPCEYLSVQVMEYLLTSIFLTWNLEIKETKILANSVCVVVRLHYLNPITEKMEFQDGVGAVPLQVNQGAKATDFEQIKSNAVQIGAPAAETYAFKDAAEKIGRLFGKDLNRADKVYYNNLDSKFKEESKPMNE